MTAPTQEKVHAPTGADVIPPQPAEVRSIVVRREAIPVESPTPVLDSAMFDHMMRIAKLMASSGLVPQHLNAIRMIERREVAIEKDEAIANCFLVVNQSVHWKMDPFAVAQHTFVHKGKLGYEGKLIAAVLNTHPMIVKRLSYTFSGEGVKRKVVVTARHVHDPEERAIEGSFEQWHTKDKDGGVNASWAKQTDQMLTYRGAREWARRWFPEAILGVWADDEVQFEYGDPQPISSAAETAGAQRGAAGLKAAMDRAAAAAGQPVTVEKVSVSSAGDDSVKGASAAPRDERRTRSVPGFPGNRRKPDAVEQQAKALEHGTVELRDKYIAKLKECTDAAILGVVMDETRLYQWFDLDALAIKDAYTKRLAELEG